MDADAVMGVLQQNATSTDSSIGRATTLDVAFGVPIVASIVLGLAADGTVNGKIFDANCPVKYRVVDATYIMRSHRSGGTPVHTLQLFNGTDAISDAADVDAAASGTVDQPYKFGTLSDAFEDIAVAGTLEAKLVLTGTTDTGATLCDCIVTLLPVK